MEPIIVDKIVATPHATKRTKDRLNQIAQHGPKSLIWIEKVSSTIDINGWSGRPCVLVSVGEKGTGNGWFGWIPQDEIIIKKEGKIVCV